jgi:hypothetical protein
VFEMGQTPMGYSSGRPPPRLRAPVLA